MITIVLSYYDNGKMLERHLREWASYSAEAKAKLGAVIVDDGSERDPAIKHMDGVGFPVSLYRIKENLVWNIPGARNLGMHVAPDGWCLLTDIDHLLEAGQAAKLVDVLDGRQIDPPSYFFHLQRRWADGTPLPPHLNSYVLPRALYWHAGGTDEDWTGWWGAGEQVFRKMIRSLAVPIEIPDIFLTHFGRADIPDASTRQWGRRKSPYDWTNNPDLVRKSKRPAYRPENPLRFDWERIECRG